ncbi:MAG: dehypoxanthine futalosine cyclase [candidate division NC10 bacterium]|nr:dehypoxanthine futalosine cyclase [candidate division NC10 bacterium]
MQRALPVQNRLSFEEGLELLEKADLLSLGRMADEMRWRLHPEPLVTFVVDRNINYTNICWSQCLFCAFSRPEGDPEAYVLPKEEIFQKIQETIELGGTQILMQGGLHPGLKLNYFLDLFRSIKGRFEIHLHALSPPEIVHIARSSSLSIKEVLDALKEAGLDSIPGGGAEILVDRVRERISPRKIRWREWAEVMETAHSLGLPTTATMMFGSVEGPEDIVTHLVRIREIQDRTRGFTAFIPWSYQPANTRLGGTTATGVEYLRILAISRLILDNIPNIQASWVTQGAKLAQVALRFGANDFGSTMIEENVVAAAGIRFRLSQNDIVRLIEDAGFKAAQRNTRYQILKVF